MASKHGTKSHREIEQLSTVDVSYISASCLHDGDWIRIPVLEGRSHSKGKGLAGTLIVFTREWICRPESIPFLRKKVFDFFGI